MINKRIIVPDFIKGLIFDCDGTLVDSMPLHTEAWKYALNKFGKEYNRDFFYSHKGMKENDIVELYNQKFNYSLNNRDVVSAKHEFFRNKIHELKPIEPVAELVYKFNGILPMAVVSGGTRKNVEDELTITGLITYFEIILTADDLFKPKPAPDLFLEAAKRMNILPKFCQVFEDGDLGIQAALNAGMLPTDVREFY